MEVTNQHVDNVIRNYIERHIATNGAARIVSAALDEAGVGLRPVLDHLSIRTLDVQERALEFEALGFAYDSNLGVMERDSWWAKVYRKPGFPPIYIDQAFQDIRGAESAIPDWVSTFSDGILHHIAISVDDIDVAVERFTAHGVRFNGTVLGEAGEPFRQIYTEPEMVNGMAFTTLELVERRWGYTGFLSPAAPTEPTEGAE